MIVSNTFLRAKYGEGIRARLSRMSRVDTIVDLAGLPVFRGATVRTIVLLTTKEAQKENAAYGPPLPTDDFRNSGLAFFFFWQTCAALEGPGEAHLRFFGQYLDGFPVALASLSEASRTSFTKRVTHQLALQRSVSAARTAHERTVLQRQIEATALEIDRLVYDLYGLTGEEIRIVEESTAKP